MSNDPECICTVRRDPDTCTIAEPTGKIAEVNVGQFGPSALPAETTTPAYAEACVCLAGVASRSCAVHGGFDTSRELPVMWHHVPDARTIHETKAGGMLDKLARFFGVTRAEGEGDRNLSGRALIAFEVIQHRFPKTKEYNLERLSKSRDAFRTLAKGLEKNIEQLEGKRVPDRKALIAYARLTCPPLYTEVCEGCGHQFTGGQGHHSACPKCHPTGPTLSEQLSDRETWPGIEFVWDEYRGPQGQWVLLEGLALIPVERLRGLADVIGRDNLDWNNDIHTFAGSEIERLRSCLHEVRGPARERAETEGRRASELADKLTTTERDLREKRADCDALRDRLEKLEGKR
jgi:hypothetical protein